jgi:hypothetical protein
MNEHEVRLGLVRVIRDVLVDLAAEDGTENDDLLAMEEAMTDAADIILDALQVEVVSAEDQLDDVTLLLRATLLK